MAADLIPALSSVLSQRIGTVLGTRKNQHLMPATGGEQVAEQFFLRSRSVSMTFWSPSRPPCCVGNIDRHRVVQQAGRQFANFRREGGREHQVLALLGQQRDDLADVADEAHVEHAVGFIENENSIPDKVDRALLHVVEQATRRGNQNIDAAAQVGDLRIDADAAKDGQ
jgi:hypothetical protein